MRRYDSRKLINIYTELRPASSVALISAGLVIVFLGVAPLGAAIILNGIVFGVMSLPPVGVRQRMLASRKRRRHF